MIELILVLYGIFIIGLIISCKQAYSRIDILKDDLDLAHNKIALLETKFLNT